jgi:hypothetical protein
LKGNYVKGGVKMKQLAIIMSLICILSGGTLTANASTIKNLPKTETSDHWKVTLAKPDIGELNAKKGVNVYSVDIKNIGAMVYDPSFKVYRDEPNTRTLYYLTSSKKLGPSQDFFHHQNLPVSNKAKTIEVIVTWNDKPYELNKNGKKYSARKFKQTFIFKQE